MRRIWMLLAVPVLWHTQQIETLRWKILLSLLIFSVAVGVSLFMESFQLKLIWMECWLIGGAVLTLNMFVRFNTAIIGTELGALFEAAQGTTETRRLISDAGASAYNYAQFVGALLASELAVGQIALWLPTYKNPALAVLVLVAALALLSFSIWQAGVFYWPKIVAVVSWFTLLVGVIGLMAAGFFPVLSQRVTAPIGGGGVDKILASLVDGTASAEMMMVVVVVGLALVYLLRRVASALSK